VHEKAKALYDSGMSLADIAAKLKTKPSTVRMWKKRESWEGAVTSQNVTQQSDVTIEAIQSVISNTTLNPKQQLFCLHYSRSFNATKSYQKAYECDYMTACASGPRLLDNVRVRDEINRLKEQRYSQAMLKPSDIFQKYMDIAFADITDYITWIARDIETDSGIETINNMSFVPSDQIDGTIITEVKTGKSDSIKLADRMKALDWLAEHMNMATEEQQAKLGLIQAQTKKLNEDDSGTTQKSRVVIHYDI
jgi:phage terminase small subunit